jgi:hypothetical protein
MKEIPDKKLEYTLLHEGTWDFSLTLPEKDASLVYEVDQEVGAYGVRIKKIQLSPISFTVHYDNWYNMEEGLKAKLGMDITDIDIERGELDEYVFMEPVQPQAFAMKDGSILYLNDLGYTGGSEGPLDEERKEYVISQGLEQVIDVDAVEGVLFGGLTEEQMQDDSGTLRPAREDLIEIKLK